MLRAQPTIAEFGGSLMPSSSSCTSRPIRHTAHIVCQIVRERDFKLVADRVLNLSIQGMLVAPADPVLTGEKLIVSFQLPDDGEWVDATATVARVVHGRRPGEFRRALGLEFEGFGAALLFRYQSVVH
jgi:hypothetical protein